MMDLSTVDIEVWSPADSRRTAHGWEPLEMVDMRTIGRPNAGRRRSRARAAFVQAAADVFVEGGYSVCSMRELAERMHSTRSAIYYYFESKGELFLNLQHYAVDIAYAVVEPIAMSARPAPERMHDMAVAHAKLMMDEPNCIRVAVDHAQIDFVVEGEAFDEANNELFRRKRGYNALFERVIAAGIASGDFHSGAPDLMALSTIGALTWISVWWDRSDSAPGEAERAEVAEEFARFVVAALGNRGLRTN